MFPRRLSAVSFFLSVSRSSDPIIETAAGWLVRLEADDAVEREEARIGFDIWRRADPRHEQAAASMSGLIGQLGMISGHSFAQTPAAAALGQVFSETRKQRRRTGVRNILLLCLASAVGWLALTMYPPSYLMADVRTGAGEWRTVRLDDGSELTLSGASAVDVQMAAGKRVVQLIQGEVLVKVARDKSRPFRVETADGSVTALGTEFVVSRGAGDTTVSMIESRTAIRAVKQADLAATMLSAGQQIRFTQRGADAPQSIDAGTLADAWKTHSLVVEGAPLTAVLDRLARQRPGVLRYDARALVGIEVSAVLPLDDPERSMQLLANSLPQLRVRSLSRYFVWVDVAPS